MTTKHREQRVGIFIDIQNLYHSAKNLYQSRVNYQTLLRELVSGRKLVRCLAYVVKAEGVGEADPNRLPSGEGAFFDALKAAGIELRMKDILVYQSGAKKADWDVGMAVDAIRLADSYDAAVLVTGDGDFVPLVEYLKWGLGKQVEVAAFSRTTSSKLREAADIYLPIEEMPRIFIKSERARASRATPPKPAA